MIIRERNRLHRIRVKTLTVVVVTKKIVVPLESFDNQDLATIQQQARMPKNYKSYLRQAKRREPRIYNGNYASTINSFSLGFRTDQIG